MGRLIGYLSAGICVFAGIYLLQYNAVDTSAFGGAGTSWFQIIGHGMGIYFIGKGLFVARTTHLEADAADRLDKLVMFAGLSHPDVEVKPAASGLLTAEEQAKILGQTQPPTPTD